MVLFLSFDFSRFFASIFSESGDRVGPSRWGKIQVAPTNKAIEEEKEKNGQKLKGVYRRRERVKRGREEGEKNNAAHAPPRRFSLVFSL